MTACASCAVGDWQAAHPDCLHCGEASSAPAQEPEYLLVQVHDYRRGNPFAEVRIRNQRTGQDYAGNLYAITPSGSLTENGKQARLQQSAASTGTAPQGWQPIETAPKDEIVDFWIVPLSPEESFVDTSGKPIFATGPGRRHTGRLKTWGALYKATHWSRPLPSPPPEPTTGGTK